MKTINLQGVNYSVNPRLESFNINSIPSKGINFFGSNPQTGSLFIQFKNGGTYIYSGVPQEVKSGLFNADSIGRYVTTNIVGKYASEKLEGVGVEKN